MGAVGAWRQPAPLIVAAGQETMDLRSPKPKVNGRTSAPAFDWPAFREHLRALYAPPLAAEATWRKHRQVIDELERQFDRPEALGSPVAVARMVDLWSTRVGVHTVHSLLRALRRQCALLAKAGTIERSPFELRNWFPRLPAEQADKHLDYDQIERLLARADLEDRRAVEVAERFRTGRTRALVHLVAFTGVRAGEALHADRDDVRDGFLWITDEHHRTKTAASRQPVPLAAPLAALLADWIERIAPRRFLFGQSRADKPWTTGTVRYRPTGMVAALGERAGVPGVTLQRLRHSWATHAESRWGLTEAQIQRVLRHSNPRTQQTYRHADLTNLRAIAGRIGFDCAAGSA